MEALDILRQRFLERLATQTLQLKSMLEREKFVQDGEQKAELVALIHSIAGAAGTFGFPAISERAASIEDRLRSGVLDQEQAARDAFKPFLQELDACIADNRAA